MEQTNRTTVVVKHGSESETINAYDRDERLMSLCLEKEKNPTFSEREQSVADVKDILMREVPYFELGPKYKWITAADFFVCAESHGDLVLPHLSASERRRLSQTVLGHLSWKFYEWYSDKSILELAAGPLLTEMMQHIDDKVNAGTSAGELRLYSGLYHPG